MSTYVGKWDCPSCGTKRIPGWKDGRTVERCPVCGGPTTGKWYLDNRDMVISNAEEVAKAKAKRAWKCGHCGHMNDADDHDCDACGNPKDATTDDKQIVAREYGGLQEPKTSEDTLDPRSESVGNSPSEAAKAMSKSRQQAQVVWEKKMAVMRQRRWIVAGAGVAGLLLIAFLLLWKKEVNVTVVGFSWKRTVDIENFGPVRESSWYSAPSGAYNITSAREVHHYNTIVIGRDCHTETSTEVCGTTDNGNGTFSDRYCTTSREVCEDRTREEPVYEMRYYYDIDKWHFDHTEIAEKKDHNAYWPHFEQTKTTPTLWREGARTETYWLHLLEDGTNIQLQDVPFERWKNTKDRQKMVGYKNVVFGYWMGLKGEK